MCLCVCGEKESSLSTRKLPTFSCRCHSRLRSVTNCQISSGLLPTGAKLVHSAQLRPKSSANRKCQCSATCTSVAFQTLPLPLPAPRRRTSPAPAPAPAPAAAPASVLVFVRSLLFQRARPADVNTKWKQMAAVAVCLLLLPPPCCSPHKTSIMINVCGPSCMCVCICVCASRTRNLNRNQAVMHRACTTSRYAAIDRKYF